MFSCKLAVSHNISCIASDNAWAAVIIRCGIKELVVVLITLFPCPNPRLFVIDGLLGFTGVDDCVDDCIDDCVDDCVDDCDVDTCFDVDDCEFLGNDDLVVGFGDDDDDDDDDCEFFGNDDLVVGFGDDDGCEIGFDDGCEIGFDGCEIGFDVVDADVTVVDIDFDVDTVLDCDWSSLLLPPLIDFLTLLKKDLIFSILDKETY